MEYWTSDLKGGKCIVETKPCNHFYFYLDIIYDHLCFGFECIAVVMFFFAVALNSVLSSYFAVCPSSCIRLVSTAYTFIGQSTNF